MPNAVKAAAAKTVADWVYPLSSRSGFWFELPDGSSTQDTSPANFEASVLRATSDDYWTISTNYRRVRPGDRVWVYYGHADGDLGVVGLARVRRTSPPADGRADLHLRWDKARTRRLILNPVPAPFVRQFIWPRAAVAGIHAHPKLVARLQRHADLAPAGPTTKAPATASTITYTPPRRITVHRRHDALIGPVRTRLETCGWRIDPFVVRPRRVDLAMAKGKRVLLIEFKTIGRSTFQAVRDAFAQLHEYRWRYRSLQPADGRDIDMWAVLERRPEDDDVRFLEDLGLLVSWASPAGRRLDHGVGTLRRLRRLSIST